MSTIIMTQCWPLVMSPSAKMVLISLADNANDDGYCWPSLERIAQRACLGRSTVIRAIKWLEARGILIANRDNGRKTTYIIRPKNYQELPSTAGEDLGLDEGKPVSSGHPSRCDTGVAVVENPCHGDTGPVSQRDTNRHITIIEPSLKTTRAKSGLSVGDLVSRGVGEQIAKDFLSARKTKFTETALGGFEREARRAGISLDRAMMIAVERGWQGFRADWVTRGAGNGGAIGDRLRGFERGDAIGAAWVEQEAERDAARRRRAQSGGC